MWDACGSLESGLTRVSWHAATSQSRDTSLVTSLHAATITSYTRTTVIYRLRCFWHHLMFTQKYRGVWVFSSKDWFEVTVYPKYGSGPAHHAPLALRTACLPPRSRRGISCELWIPAAIWTVLNFILCFAILRFCSIFCFWGSDPSRVLPWRAGAQLRGQCRSLTKLDGRNYPLVGILRDLHWTEIIYIYEVWWRDMVLSCGSLLVWTEE